MSEALRQRDPPIKDAAHLNFVRDQPCCACGKSPRSAAAHIRYTLDGVGKRGTGMAEKPSDRYTVPLCDPGCHKEAPGSQHSGNEEAFWLRIGVDPFALAERLWIASGAAERHRFDAPGPSLRKPRKAKPPKPDRAKRNWPKRGFPKGQRGFKR